MTLYQELWRKLDWLDATPGVKAASVRLDRQQIKQIMEALEESERRASPVGFSDKDWRNALHFCERLATI